MTRKCLYCGKEFEVTTPNKKTCSKECGRKRDRQLAELRGPYLPGATERKKKKNQNIIDMTVEARKNGMTYGQYDAQVNMKKYMDELFGRKGK